MISGYWGGSFSLNELRKEHSSAGAGATLLELTKAAEGMALKARAVRCQADALASLKLPVILHWNRRHFVVLAEITKRGATILDPADGKKIISAAALLRQFSGVALECSPDQAFIKSPPPRFSERLPAREFVRIGRKEALELAKMVAVTLLVQGLLLVSPFYMQVMIDQAIPRSDVSLMVAVACGFSAVLVVEVLASVWRNLIANRLSHDLALSAKHKLFSRLIRLPIKYFARRSVGDTQQKFAALRPITDVVVNGLTPAVFDIVALVAVTFVLAAYDPLLLFIIMSFTLAYCGLRWLMMPLQRNQTGEVIDAVGAEQSLFLETVRTMASVKSMSAEARREKAWLALAAQTSSAMYDAAALRALATAIGRAFFGLGTVVVILFAAMKVAAAEMTVGMIAALVAYKHIFEQRASTLVELGSQLATLKANLDRVADIALAEPEDVEPKGQECVRHTGPFNGAVHVESLRFKYGQHASEVLCGANLLVRPGECAAILGRSGCGKSTLLKVIGTLESPSQGTVVYDKTAVGSWQLGALRSGIAFVLQDDALLSGTILQNISMFDETPDEEFAIECAKLACIHDFVSALPMKYQTSVGELGALVSGGQRQRLILARALYKKPKLLLLDEATAHLDVETEERVGRNVAKLEITRIVVSHRPETARLADAVYFMRDGRLVRVDNDRELLSQRDMVSGPA